MKSFKTYISEAVATRKKPTRAEKNEFADKFDQVLYSKPFTDLQDKRYLHKWHITGHNANAKHGTSKAIEATKERVFGKRRKGTSDLLWMHHKHGLVTHPAIGDVTHSDVQDNYRPRKGIKVNKKIQAKVMEGGSGGILGRGRIEHHEGGGGIISYSHGGVGSRAAAVRTIARAYPKYKIHDGHGNLLEGYGVTKDGWLHSRALGRRRWMKGSHSIERQGKRGWTVYDWHASKELHVAKTARDAKAWSEKNRSTAAPTHEPINIRLFENWSYEDIKVKSFKRYINEAKEETITDFVRFAAKQLGLQQEPNIEFVDVRDGSMTTAAYSPSDCSMKIYRGNRATFDICRSIAHEMVHQMQDENGDELDGTTGSPCEDEANAVAGRLIRMYGSENDSFYEE